MSKRACSLKRFVVVAPSFPEVPFSAADFRLAEALTVAARQLHEQGSPRDALHTAARLAVHVVPGVDHAGIVTVGRDLVPDSVTWSDEVARSAQALTGMPGHRAFWERLWAAPVAALADTAAGNGSGLSALGVRSVLALRLRTDRNRLTALVLYGRKPGGHDEASLRVGRMLAAHVSVAHDSATVQEQLTEAMRTRDLIGQATGLLMAREGVDAAEAFAHLVRASQQQNVKLRELAQRYVDAAAPARDA
ncbi:ANTAR domain-containing protein [Streptomyces sp. NPDC102467]|uniref:ANTAR domain-containing protein n=1 Tax=Streptomyces sp. NPDC102467 TaxID=3366179 RepID=UPI0037F52D76